MSSISFSKASHNDLVLIAEKGINAKHLMQEGSFFKDHVVPLLEEDLKDLEGSLIWGPGSTDKSIEAIGIDRVWKSGIAHGIGKIWLVLNRLKNEGLEAEKEMGLREKKKVL